MTIEELVSDTLIKVKKELPNWKDDKNMLYCLTQMEDPKLKLYSFSKTKAEELKDKYSARRASWNQIENYLKVFDNIVRILHTNNSYTLDVRAETNSWEDRNIHHHGSDRAGTYSASTDLVLELGFPKINDKTGDRLVKEIDIGRLNSGELMKIASDEKHARHAHCKNGGQNVVSNPLNLSFNDICHFCSIQECDVTGRDSEKGLQAANKKFEEFLQQYVSELE